MSVTARSGFWRGPWPWLAAAALAAGVALYSTLGRQAPSDPRPFGGAAEIEALARRHDTNVLFVLIDTLRADRLHTYGYARPTSPLFEALARPRTLVPVSAPHGRPRVHLRPGDRPLLILALRRLRQRDPACEQRARPDAGRAGIARPAPAHAHRHRLGPRRGLRRAGHRGPRARRLSRGDRGAPLDQLPLPAGEPRCDPTAHGQRRYLAHRARS